MMNEPWKSLICFGGPLDGKLARCDDEKFIYPAEELPVREWVPRQDLVEMPSRRYVEYRKYTTYGTWRGRIVIKEEDCKDRAFQCFSVDGSNETALDFWERFVDPSDKFCSEFRAHMLNLYPYSDIWPEDEEFPKIVSDYLEESGRENEAGFCRAFADLPRQTAIVWNFWNLEKAMFNSCRSISDTTMLR